MLLVHLLDYSIRQWQIKKPMIPVRLQLQGMDHIS